MFKKIAIFIFVFTILCVNVYAHSGGTDGSGGHNSPRGYHYHHGQPAHQHPNGVCPYDESETDSIQEKIENGTPLTKDEYREYKGLPPIEEEEVEETAEDEKENDSIIWLFVEIIVFVVVVRWIYKLVKKKRE